MDLGDIHRCFSIGALARCGVCKSLTKRGIYCRFFLRILMVEVFNTICNLTLLIFQVWHETLKVRMLPGTPTS
jgi:hypothetical protein